MPETPICDDCGRPMTLSGTENYWYCSRDACAGKKLVDLRAEIERLQQQSEAQHKSYGEVVGRLNAAEAVRDRWRRTAERLEGEKQEQAKEIEQLKRNGVFHVDVCTAHLRHIKELQKELAEQTEQENRHILMSHNVEQTLGKILCYPWYKDDKKNFPGATEEDGVCVGEDTIETLADRAAERIRHLEEEISALREKLRNGRLSSDKLAEELKDRDNRIADLTASRDEWRISAKINADAATTHQQRIEKLQDQIAILLRQQRKLAVTVNNQTLRIAELVGEDK